MASAFDDFTSALKPTLDTVDPKSPPGAFLLQSTDNAQVSSYYAKTLSVTPTVFELAMDIKLDASQLFAFQIRFAGATPYVFEIQPGNTSFYFAEKLGDTTVGESSNPGLLPKSWHSFRFRVDFSIKRYGIFLGGGTVLERDMALQAHTGQPTVSFGALFHSGSPFSLRIDNLTISAN